MKKGHDNISVEAIWSGMGRWRYVLQGQGVQQGQFLHLSQADPEEKKEEREERGADE